jgi:hypothetical protein
LLHDVLNHRNYHACAFRSHLLRKLLQQISSSRHRDHARTLARKRSGDRAADADAGSGHDGGSGFELKIHVCCLSRCKRLWILRPPPFPRRRLFNSSTMKSRANAHARCVVLAG